MKGAFQLALLTLLLTQSQVQAQDGAQAAMAQQQAWGAAQQVQLAREEADSREYRQMERVGSYMDQYCAQNHRWPDQGEETTFIQQQLNQLVPVNPYSQGPWSPSSTDSVGPSNIAGNLPTDMYNDNVPQGNRVQLVFDPSLTAIMAKEYINDPPEDWRGAPGSITAISNNQDLFVVWGAGFDGKPIRNAAGQMRLIFGRFGMLYYGE